MPALNGQTIMTLTNAAGVPAVTITWFFDPATMALRNNPTSWTAPDGTVYPAGTGAVIADNQLGRTIRMRINNAAGEQIRRIQLPAGGRSVTATQLANAAPPDGPYTSANDLNGITFELG